MTVKTSAEIDIEVFKRAYEEWDIEALLGFYADDVELVQIDRENPPSAPRVRHGKDVFRGMFEHCAAARVKATVEHAFAGEDRAAATVTCEFPGGRKVLANAILELETAASSASETSWRAIRRRPDQASRPGKRGAALTMERTQVRRM